LTLVQAATAAALVDLDAGRRTGALSAYRSALKKFWSLLGALTVAVIVSVVFDLSVVLLPVLVWIAVRWMLLAQAIELEDLSALSGLRRSYALVRGHWFRVASLVGVGALITFAAGPLIGAGLILLTDAPLTLLNIVAGVVYALAMPFVALTTSYVY